MSGKLEEIAAELNVSVSTVSRALSGKPGVSAKKRKFIEDLAKKYGYSPNVFASNLRTGKKHGLTVITSMGLTDIANYRNAVLFSLGKNAYETVRVISYSENDDLSELIRSAIASGSKGIILSHLNAGLSESIMRIATNNQVPLLSIDHHYEGIDNVVLDRSNGTYQAARMLLLSGCKSPVFYSARTDLSNPDDRLLGIINAYKSLNISLDQINLVPSPKDYDDGYNLTKELLNSRQMDGIFAYNDTVAISALRCLYKLNVKVPDQVKVIGFDNLPVTAHLPIALTTVAQPMDEMVQCALDLIKEKMANFSREPVTKSFNSNLIVRESAPISDHALRQEVFKPIDI